MCIYTDRKCYSDGTLWMAKKYLHKASTTVQDYGRTLCLAECFQKKRWTKLFDPARLTPNSLAMFQTRQLCRGYRQHYQKSYQQLSFFRPFKQYGSCGQQSREQRQQFSQTRPGPERKHSLKYDNKGNRAWLPKHVLSLRTASGRLDDLLRNWQKIIRHRWVLDIM